ncbi:transmembrane protein 170B isoform X3 [Canis aureus]
MKAEGGDHSMINLSVQQVLSLWAHGTVLRNLTEMWYWIFLWALFSSLFVHGAAGVLMFVMLQRHRQGRVISLIAVSIGFLASVTGAMITRLFSALITLHLEGKDQFTYSLNTLFLYFSVMTRSARFGGK